MLKHKNVKFGPILSVTVIYIFIVVLRNTVILICHWFDYLSLIILVKLLYTVLCICFIYYVGTIYVEERKNIWTVNPTIIQWKLPKLCLLILLNSLELFSACALELWPVQKPACINKEFICTVITHILCSVYI